MKSNIHYKFKSARDCHTVKFEGRQISCADLKKLIIGQMNAANTGAVDLDLSNAQTKEADKNEDMVPRNASVLVVRVPVVKRRKRKASEELEAERLALVEEYKRKHKALPKVNEAKPVTDRNVRPRQEETQVAEVKWEELKELLPIEMICPICQYIIKDAVCCACCGNSACGECVRKGRMASKDDCCPICTEPDLPLDKIMKNNNLRAHIKRFVSDTLLAGTAWARW